ncbi:T9SS type B sorting domain-containing protein [Robiginitalea sp. SC105]|uniref:T9SS type B sorting domain-containing protein n=1 Tax=Robiginitalea sp. SC105 TaxID=2762332 RepID=UPI001639D921|nr:T9SS type B sorting domain-containing protein [Robiginitalea sp. SC105]MBC2839949.1 T9SS type B sorting domain-containing protein [Robiginitalea sp. SC105]
MKMLKKLLCAAGLLAMLSAQAQECPQLLSPQPGAVDVPVTTTISWEGIVGVPGYSLSLGTTPGDNDILNVFVGPATSHTPTLGLPETTQIYATITLFFFNQPNIVCDSFVFTTEDVTTPPPCTQLQSPANGATNVPVASNIRWNNSPTATGYRISLGTTPGGVELVDNLDLMNALLFDPPADLDPDTVYYVRITPYNENGDNGPCEEYSFTTGPLATLPGCTTMVSPANGAFNVSLSPQLEWNPVAGADGYRVSIGSTPLQNDVLDGVSLDTNRTDVLNFEPNSVYFIRIVPFNEAGEALDCTQESFSTILGCGPYFEALTGELIDLHPEVTFPESVGICLDNPANTVSATDTADGYRWYVIESPGRERLLATGPDFEIPGEGTYRHEIFNVYQGPAGEFECSSSREFTAVSSEAAMIRDTDVRLGAGVIRIEVLVSGTGNYEFALGDAAGPYQDSNVFSGLPLDSYRIFVRDKNGCGISEVLVEPDLTAEGFPNFFTPNGDGRNDRWQFIVPESGINPVREISVFDRYGNLVARVDPQSEGWDGTRLGSPLPASDYWYRAVDNQGGVVTGHFTLKR